MDDTQNQTETAQAAADNGYIVQRKGAYVKDDMQHAGEDDVLSGLAVGDYVYVALDAATPSTWQERLIEEGVQLSARLEKLQLFMAEPGFKKLPIEDQHLMGAQAQYMIGYVNVLAKRCARLPQMASNVIDCGDPGNPELDAPGISLDGEASA